jgi:hypothetical protein
MSNVKPTCSMTTVQCICCNHWINDIEEVPAIDDEPAWAAMAEEHGPRCYWIKSRAYCQRQADIHTREYFAPAAEQRTLFQEGVCRPGWVQPLPEAPAAPLYTPNA